jgi:serine/threonine protein kinase
VTSRFGLCEHCFRAGRPAAGACPRCGYRGEPTNAFPALPESTSIGSGRYLLGRKEGQGGFSICYRAWDGQKDEIVAIKELYPDQDWVRRLPDGSVAVDRSQCEGFDRALNSALHEATVLRRLDQEPAIVHVRDVFEENGTIYLVMEHLRGKSYDEYLRDHHRDTGMHIAPGSAVNVALVVLGALQAVHERNLLHLDVKPSNVRALDHGRIVLLDFGSARAAFAGEEGGLGNMFSPGFAAPEQHPRDGQPIEVTAATDIYGAAALIYYSLSLTVPTPADERRSDDLSPPLSELNPAVPLELDLVIYKAMSLDPRDRYQSVAEFKEALKPFQAVVAPQISSFPKTSPRLVTGLLDIVAAMWLLVLLRSAFALQEQNALTSGVLLWGLLQQLPWLIGATPGMLVTRLRVTGENGDKPDLTTMLLRTIYLLQTLITFRYRTDEDGLMPHDRSSNSRVVRRKAIMKILPSLADSSGNASSRL